MKRIPLAQKEQRLRISAEAPLAPGCLVRKPVTSLAKQDLEFRSAAVRNPDCLLVVVPVASLDASRSRKLSNEAHVAVGNSKQSTASVVALEANASRISAPPTVVVAIIPVSIVAIVVPGVVSVISVVIAIVASAPAVVPRIVSTVVAVPTIVSIPVVISPVRIDLEDRAAAVVDPDPVRIVAPAVVQPARCVRKSLNDPHIVTSVNADRGVAAVLALNADALSLHEGESACKEAPA